MSDDRQSLHERIQTAEQMLLRAIQQRKKALAQMTLETLAEIAPSHPQLPELELWVRDMDQEMALQERIDGLVAEGRAALSGDDLATARERLDSLRKLAPTASEADDFASEIEATERGRMASADIGRLKQQIEEALEAGHLPAAKSALERLQVTGVPRVTIQTYSKRIEDTSRRLRDQAEADAIRARFEQFLQAREWVNARDEAQRFGQRFADDPRATEMFQRVAELEAGDRRRQSIHQGLASVESFIAQGRKAEAELALKVLRSMLDDPARLAELEARIRIL
ncbi:MAG: hypothetical protein MI919_02725 [Holophagales bacterium]|nr:hypothetical protein [Holophagales bacterium]